MNPQRIRNLLAKTATAVGLLVMAGAALAFPNYGTTTNSYCTAFNQTAPYTGDCTLCHVSASNTATRKDPQWTWYQTAPKGASTQMQNFCPASPANQAPNGTITTPAANVTVTQGATVAFVGSGTDPDNNLPLTYSWNFGGGATSSTQQNPTVAFNTVGTFTVALTVTDAKGLADPTPATRTVTVTAAANQAPNGTITTPAANLTVTQGTTVAFAGTGTDPDNNTPLTYSWNFGGGATNSAQQNPSVVFGTPGTFTVSLAVADSKGLADPTPATRTITVTPSTTANQPPAGTITQPASDVVINVGQSVSFVGSGTDPDNNTPLTYAWNFGGGATNSTVQSPTVVFATAGTFTVSLTVTDAKGLADATPATRTVTVLAPNNQPPTASITAPASDVSILKGASISFAGSGSDPDGNTPLSYRWNFGGGGLPDSTLQNPTVRFDNVGTYSVTLTVTDRLGASNVAPPVRIVTVREALPTGCRDNDKDGFSPDGGVCGPVDCNDNNAAINPGMIERCGDGIDNDCNGKIDAADPACNGTDCLAALTQRPPVVIDRASWDAEDRELKVRGSKAPAGSAANLFNAATGALLASVVVDSSGNWSFELERLATVPCKVRVDIAGQSAEAVVSGAPASCGGGGGNPPPGNLAPDGRITAPANGVRIRLGRAVQFSGSGTDPDGNLPLTYAWDFGGGAPASAVQNPTVTFRSAGTYVVRLTVKDAKGLADPTPAQITVRVSRDD